MRVSTVQDELEAASKELVDLIEAAVYRGGVSKAWLVRVDFHNAVAELGRRMQQVVDTRNVDPLPQALLLIRDYRLLSDRLAAEMTTEAGDPA
jgi:hypothetical protein